MNSECPNHHARSMADEEKADSPHSPESIDASHSAAQADLARVATIASDLPALQCTIQESIQRRKQSMKDVLQNDPRLDPSSPSFDFLFWVTKLISEVEQEDHPLRRSGFCFQNLDVFGTGDAVKLQKDVMTDFAALFRLRELLRRQPEKQILRSLNGNVRSGEMLIVLGRPGAGCSTFLRSICGELRNVRIPESTKITYDGVRQDVFLKELKGEVVYNQETEKHFPHLTVGETLEFAASCRTPSHRLYNASREQYVKHITAVMMKVFGLSHTKNTKVGNDYIRGVSGGERKRVSLAEMTLAGSSIAMWDNATRGLDSSMALEFIKSLRIASDVAGMTQAVAIYEASQGIYELFDKALILYEGRQIYFGPADQAKPYFERMGYQCPPRQTTADFLTAVTNPQERTPRKGFEDRVPRSPDEFARYWQSSSEHEACIQDNSDTEKHFGGGSDNLNAFRKFHQEVRAKHTRAQSPYIISTPMQIRLCIKRAYQRIWNDKASTLSTIGGQIIQALVIGSIFYGTPETTSSFYSKGSAAFFAVLLSALQSIVEINSLYDQRPIVAKHQSFAFYHPWTEAAAGILSDIPIKLVGNGLFLLTLYFLAGLRAEPAQFFTFFLFCFAAMLTMSMIFRTVAAATKTMSQAFAIAGVLVLWIAVYTGFAIQKAYMHPWFKWSIWINPVAYAYEGILANEVHGRHFPCSAASLVPPYGTGENFQCAVPGAVAGSTTVSGDAWVESAYGYTYSHIWRNLGILLAFMVFFLVTYLVATEFNFDVGSTAEVLVFRRGKVPAGLNSKVAVDEETLGTDRSNAIAVSTSCESTEKTEETRAIPAQNGVLTWKDVTLDIEIKGQQRRILNGVSGWVKPGTLTALMGSSGAGKTTLLDALSCRISIGVLTGGMFVNGRPVDISFHRKIGYVQQQDLHLDTATVREALQFSAMLRQPKSVSRTEKFQYVDQIIKLLSMEFFADSVVGVLGEGLNIEQRKLLSIAVEMVAKPELLLFLDEPTSGLDSQSSWSIVSILRRLANNGQAILCTIHQPSALVFQEFDRLLLLAKGGKTVYFGDVGEQSRTVLDYFEQIGGRHCEDDENPAEYIVELVNQNESHDWPETWKRSPEYQEIINGIEAIHAEKIQTPVSENVVAEEFAMPLVSQIQCVTRRVFEQYWRTPNYIQSKFSLVLMSALFIGFTFYKVGSTQADLQNALFSIFMLTAIFSTLVQQIMPRFVNQRSLFEVREKPSKAYSWIAFIFANILVEIPYQVLLAVLAWAAWYYPIFGAHNSSEESGLMLLFIIEFMIFASSFSQMVIAVLPDAETGGNVATLLFSMMLAFNGVLQVPDALPGFWIFMYRVSPLTYLIAGWAGTSVSDRIVLCAQNELAIFDPPSGQNCSSYLNPYFEAGALGHLYNPSATAGCEYCPLTSGAQYLAGSRIYAADAWRNFGLLWVYIIFNVFATIFLYYVFRVRKFSLDGLVEALRAILTKISGLKK